MLCGVLRVDESRRIMQVEITTWFLEMLEPQQLRFKPPGHYELRIEQARCPCPEFNRFLYASVGGEWYWLDRLSWTRDRWMDYLDRPELQTWVAYISGTPAGYFELEVQPKRNVELVYFGILPQFVGQKLGGHLLSVAVEKAWAIGQRVWVHTCNLDSPYALANYQARGFQLYKQETHVEELPSQSIGIWNSLPQPLPEN